MTLPVVRNLPELANVVRNFAALYAGVREIACSTFPFDPNDGVDHVRTAMDVGPGSLAWRLPDHVRQEMDRQWRESQEADYATALAAGPTSFLGIPCRWGDSSIPPGEIHILAGTGTYRCLVGSK